jgi:chromosome segregation and condensation protein ScpB
MNKQRKNEKTHTKAEIVAWIELRQPVTRGKLLRAFEDMDYEQLQCWLSELQLKRKLFEVNPETYYTTIEERK